MAVMHGNIFEKVGVNISTVYGKLSNDFKKNLPGTNKSSHFWASGISIVAHMQNPYLPSFHFNTRMIETSTTWFGGGMDMTPTFKNIKHKKMFHKKIKNMCDTHDKSYHGLPDPIKFPEEISRKSILLYYYTKEPRPAEQIKIKEAHSAL